MSIKKNSGLAGIDMIIAVIAITIFSTFILSLMSNHAIENVKLGREASAMIYITEIFENIAMADFNEISDENINNFIPPEVFENYEVQIIIENEFQEIDEEEEKILKKIDVTLTYEIKNKTYSCSMQRLKVKE